MILEQLIHLDKSITLFINGLNSPLTDQLWIMFSDKHVWYPAYAAVAFLFIWRFGWKKGLAAIVACVLALVLCDQISTFIKYGVERLRPCFDNDMLTGGLHHPVRRGYGFFGFFSSHASNCFGFVACALTMAKMDLKRTPRAVSIAAWTWAALVSVSRVMVGKHFFGDIIVGTFYGLLCGYAVGYLMLSLIKRYSRV